MEVAAATLIVAAVGTAVAPSVISDTEKAHQRICAENEKKIGDAMLAYVQDNDGNFPMEVYYQPNFMPFNWQSAIDPYFKRGIQNEPNVWFCPSIPIQQPAEYGINWELCRDGAGTWAASQPGYVIPIISYRSVDHPYEKAMMVEKGEAATFYEQDIFDPTEGNWTNPLVIVNGKPTQPDTHNELQWDFDCTATEPECQNWATTPSDMPRFRHNSRCNTLMVDGHVVPIE